MLFGFRGLASLVVALENAAETMLTGVEASSAQAVVDVEMTHDRRRTRDEGGL
jgi:hypothetical protein